MNILVTKYSVQSISLLIAYVSMFPEQKETARIMCSFWSTRTLRHIFKTISPILDTQTEAQILASVEPMVEVVEGIWVSKSKADKRQKVAQGDFVNYAICVNPQLFKLMEMAV